MSNDCKTERAKKPAEAKPLELAKVREALTNATGPTYWRSLEELSNTEGFQEMLHREFPRQASEWTDDFSRRNFLKVMGASLALAGLSACTKQPIEHILPYVRQPEEEVPGKPLYYATVMSFAGRSVPVLVKSNEGRPIKIEGNPDHPAGQEGSDIFSQASILDMYDPDRSQNVLLNNDGSSWGSFLGGIRGPLTSQKGMQGEGLRFLTGAITSPTLASQLNGILKLYPKAKWHKYEPLPHDGQTAAFGQPVSVQHNFENADVILSLDCDFLTSAENPSFLRDALAFGKRRKAENGDRMNRMYVVESSATTTGGKADHRLRMAARDIEHCAHLLAATTSGGNYSGMGQERTKWILAAAEDLRAHAGRSIVLAGRHQSPVVHAIAYEMNQALGNIGKTITYSEAVDYNPPNHPGDIASLRDLVNVIDAGRVNILVFVGTNPVFNAPVDLAFDEARLHKVDLRVHFGQYHDETAKYCHWHVPESHYLEAWSDVRCADGTMSIVQPLIAPLYMSKSVHEFLAPFGELPASSGYEIVQDYWKAQHAGADFDVWWRRSLHNGFMENTGGSLKTVTAKAAAASAAPPLNNGEIEILFRPDPNIFDGRFGNNGWLQELPKPITMLTWENAALVSFTLAEKLGVVSGDQVDIASENRKLTMPIWITAGLPDNSIVLQIGYGHEKYGRFGTDAGWNTYTLRTSKAPDIAVGTITKSSEASHLFGAVHLHHNIEGRGTVRIATVEEFAKNPAYAHNEEEYGGEPSKDFTIYHQKEFRYEQNTETNTLGYAWGMAIDMNSCIGCNTCMVACQAENNIAVVGRDEVIRGREMHWIRVDNYFTGDGENFQAHFQPVPCMQCENAPCEVVCPVAATSHSTEGLNDMVYNRCVGTRYCSNNCPYKVRRFNFFLFSDYETPSLKLLHNPDVTVRSRGVMEKCTYCVQRINRARITAEIAETRIGDELKPACQQACPADAIVFGDINNPNSRVSKLKAQPRNFGLLADLNTRPRTTYLATVVNPNPALGERPAGPPTKVEHGRS